MNIYKIYFVMQNMAMMQKEKEDRFQSIIGIINIKVDIILASKTHDNYKVIYIS